MDVRFLCSNIGGVFEVTPRGWKCLLPDVENIKIHITPKGIEIQHSGISSIIKAVGKLKPSIFHDTNSVNFSSTFIVPIPHNVHVSRDIKRFFTSVDVNWEIKNNTIEKDLFLSSSTFFITSLMFFPFIVIPLRLLSTIAIISSFIFADS